MPFLPLNPRTSLTLTLAITIAAIALLGGCSGSAASKSPARLRVLAAASLAGVFKEIGAAFEAAHPEVRLEFSFGGSNQLRGQLEQGGPGDVFASADRKQIDAGVASRVVASDTVRVFAHNRLAVLLPAANPASIATLSDLARPGVRIVVADKAVPAGDYTVRMLRNAAALPEYGPAFAAAFDANVVSREESVSGVVAKVALGEVDAGIAYATDASGELRDKVTMLALPKALEQRANYAAAVTSRSAQPALAGAFVEFLSSKEAGSLLAKRGFFAPGTESP